MPGDFEGEKEREKDKNKPPRGGGDDTVNELFSAVYQKMYKSLVFLNYFPYLCAVKPKKPRL